MALSDITSALRSIAGDISQLSGKVANYADDLPNLTGAQQTVLKTLLKNRIDALVTRLTSTKSDVDAL